VKKVIIAAIFCLTLIIRNASALAAAPPTLITPPGLSIAEIQITGDEFIILQNNTTSTITDLNSYWLYYFNKTDPTGLRPTFIQLPAGSLAVGQTVQLSTVGRSACGASVVDNLSSSLVDSGGFIEVVKFNINPIGTINETVGDSVSWSSGSTGNIQKVASATPQPVWYRYQATSVPTYGWQKASTDPSNACQLLVSSGSLPAQPVSTASLLSGTANPPATIVYLSPSDGGSKLPQSDNGLMAPLLTEILPNPKSPQTDAHDEFVELYNPNNQSFDLSGFQLQAGTDSPHTFTFGNGTMLKLKSFTFFLSADTSLSLTNDSGQVKLLNPSGDVLNQTEAYDSAPDGQSWALANGHWYWTNQVTPGQPNIVNQDANGSGATPAGTTSSSSSGSPSQTKGSSTSSSGNFAGGSSNSSVSSKPVSSPLHPMILVAVGAMALSYALYEYRHDLANILERLRRYRQARRAARTTTKSAAGNRAASRPGRRQDNLRPWFSQRFGSLRQRFQSQLHSKPRVQNAVWYEALPLRLLSVKRIRRPRR